MSKLLKVTQLEGGRAGTWDPPKNVLLISVLEKVNIYRTSFLVGRLKFGFMPVDSSPLVFPVLSPSSIGKEVSFRGLLRDTLFPRTHPLIEC